METIQIVQEAPASLLEPVVVVQKAPEAVQSLGRAMLTGIDARLAQAANLTAGVRPRKLPYFAV